MDIVIILVKIGLMIGFLMVMGLLLTWVERKQSAVMQDRIGANRADILGMRLIGLFHPLADALKLLTKEDFVPPSGNRFIHTLAPFIAFTTALVGFAVIPFGPPIHLFHREITLQVADIHVGILFVFVAAGLSIYGVILAGWSSANRYSLLGALRGAAQTISYEVSMGLSVIGLLMIFGSLSLSEIAHAQGELIWGFLPRWGVMVQPLGFLIFFTAAVAETKRVPFDLPEGESEIIGFFLEYSGMKFGLLWIGEFVEIVVMSGLITALFFGGWQVPFLYEHGFEFPWGTRAGLPHGLVLTLQVASFVFKVAFFCWFQMLVRWTFPRFRYDQLMRLGWKGLLPLSFLNIVVTGIVVLVF
ncbi:MAG: NADH-quinone oxidoreductase subunit NuoH [Nitrospirae bacterium CG_4_9_14_3_um_filter_53_35]|nr:MAG: NADH-quinone oxidoreductase subunit H [Nitrospirae bacterium CG2_30_53_67]PIS38009.1 MAG: NADH-quinone oxidoreductase subunit NuoH [Nitrospirae bacterium CG08_land_8_20_14_0_20_52_24]PIV82888.1 MAG: NADH-quinone oxidoreductase subunit NuoH [Nitrospirae bacterium CG17_big_fil_post_rev_8_21_14_2_50_50_9]PIX85891.1 MAG: NADH-quinone oxidoreductase subunit NuoH [Nitrospirae bacterium CG_4_10_14_3_um_filter_53_41]PJA73684.1 MAG: NADH-quinone oxidoreductase subunit NuoH [Nitrospirae bacterium